MNDLEKTGDKFNLNTFLEARELCIEVTESIIKKIQPGDHLKSIETLIVESFKAKGVTHFWHPTKVRISSDTVKSFREISDPNLKCVTSDICFLDLGPIINGHEADYGRTFAIDSEDLENPLISASHQVFEETAKAWKQKNMTGVELLDFARASAEAKGFEINPMMAGHRLGDFPHKIFSSQKLFEWNGIPTKNLWILEIHLIDKQTHRGAFYEDLLL